MDRGLPLSVSSHIYRYNPGLSDHHITCFYSALILRHLKECCKLEPSFKDLQDLPLVTTWAYLLVEAITGMGVQRLVKVLYLKSEPSAVLFSRSERRTNLDSKKQLSIVVKWKDSSWNRYYSQSFSGQGSVLFRDLLSSNIVRYLPMFRGGYFRCPKLRASGTWRSKCPTKFQNI